MAKSVFSQSVVTPDSSDDESAESDMDKSDLSGAVCVLPRQPRASTRVSILIESLVRSICSIYETDPQEANKLYKKICDKLFTMNMIDESFKMDEFEGIRSQFQTGFIHLITSNMNNKHLSLKPIRHNMRDSHYHREFEEIQYIAGGGFGQVYLVRHKLDGTEYAMKKIPIRSEGIESVKSYLSEVKTFASLNHSNIVQYKAAWLEVGDPTYKAICSNGDVNTSTAKTSRKLSQIEDEYVFSKEMDEFSDKRSEDTDFEIDFEHSITNVSKGSIPKTKSNLIKNTKSKSASDLNALCKVNYNEIEQIRVQRKVRWATLYIQMSLCQLTLKQWLDKRNALELNQSKAIVTINPDVIRKKCIYEILIQLVRGIQYIHSKGIVHHDIKPSNIFVQRDNDNVLVQLGDFGLACPLQSARHSLAFGTKLYAAPEQLAGKCESKSDLYSLGIVLFELIQCFNTDMERVENITKLRNGVFPEDLQKRQTEFVEMIVQLTCKKYEERPDTTTILKQIEKSNESQQIEKLKQVIAEKDEEISHLKELLKSYGAKGI